LIENPSNGVIKQRNANLLIKGLIENPSDGVIKRRNA
jgi:hypothetical protein